MAIPRYRYGPLIEHRLTQFQPPVEHDHPLAVVVFTALLSAPTVAIWASLLGVF